MCWLLPVSLKVCETLGFLETVPTGDSDLGGFGGFAGMGFQLFSWFQLSSYRFLQSKKELDLPDVSHLHLSPKLQMINILNSFLVF